MLSLFALAALIASPAPTAAQEPPQRIRNVQIAKGQACPKPVGDEVVVCSTLEEPYRIPSELRNDQPIARAAGSWVNRAADIDQTSRVAAGLPDTCSPVGTGGQTGCFQAQARQWAADRRAARTGDGSGSQGR
ncbi:hypothetical protein [Sphingomonas sp.]|jgi:hypothetical protein|uniref:hypothetical protein n=1 Tax=Sphingomonas sp. TaxID=28214 RepID=UPI002D80495F|nr:hypothetical protein [Sphingomonas sp.]HEU0044896.1 hypothetical protein [Sphingomonas sp.]